MGDFRRTVRRFSPTAEDSAPPEDLSGLLREVEDSAPPEAESPPLTSQNQHRSCFQLLAGAGVVLLVKVVTNAASATRCGFATHASQMRISPKDDPGQMLRCASALAGSRETLEAGSTLPATRTFRSCFQRLAGADRTGRAAEEGSRLLTSILLPGGGGTRGNRTRQRRIPPELSKAQPGRSGCQAWRGRGSRPGRDV